MHFYHRFFKISKKKQTTFVLQKKMMKFDFGIETKIRSENITKKKLNNKNKISIKIS